MGIFIKIMDNLRIGKQLIFQIVKYSAAQFSLIWLGNLCYRRMHCSINFPYPNASIIHPIR